MPTVVMILCAAISLLVGALIEPPAARAAPKNKPPIEDTEAALKPVEPGQDYRIVSEDIAQGQSARYVAIAVPRRLAESDLARIADLVRAKEKAPFEKTVVNFYLPGMKVGQGAWATATYAPTLKVAIVGLRLDEEQSAQAEVAADRRDLIGVWLTAPPAAPGRLTLYREGGRVFGEWRLRNGAKSVEALVESRDPRGRRFGLAAGGADNYLLGWNGELALRDGTAVIAVAEKLQGVTDKVPAKTEPKTPASKASASLPRPRPEPRAANTVDTSRALSQKVFNF